MPRKVYENMEESIEEAKLVPKALLTVKELDWLCVIKKVNIFCDQINNITKQSIINAKMWPNIVRVVAPEQYLLLVTFLSQNGSSNAIDLHFFFQRPHM